MKRALLFKLIITFFTLISLSTGQSCPCNQSGYILQCNATNTLSIINTDLCYLNGYNSINIIYSGNVVLNLTTSSTKPISIKPIDISDSPTLQISAINSPTNRIQISIYLSSNQASLTLFTTSCSIIAPSSTLSIYVTQNITDASDFNIFDNPSSTKISITNYELIFNTNNTNSGTLYLPYLIFGLTNLTSIMISGNNHDLVVDPAEMRPFTYVNRLSIKNLRLYNQILYNFTNLQEYSIEGCEYNQTAQFLYSTQSYNISLIMINNIPTDLILPYDVNAFVQLGTLTSLTLIEPQLNSSCLKATIKRLAIYGKLSLSLDVYSTSDLTYWATYKPVFWYLTIGNIKDLNIFPPVFFNSFQALKQIILQGTFDLEKNDICIFLGINEQPNPQGPLLILNSSQIDENDWQNCALTYVTAINTYTISDVTCPPDNTCQDCARWANATNQCDLISYENSCPVQPDENTNIFYYNSSYLYFFFQRQDWLNGTRYPSGGGGGISTENSINIGAIIGAVCGLLVAIIILVLTIFCIRRHRQKDATVKYIPSAPQPDYKSSADDFTHVSIATSKTSKSSRYALEKSFFPPMQPNDEIAPPLYTAPSESVGSVSPYNLPSAPPAPRDSISTHATHVYETVDS